MKTVLIAPLDWGMGHTTRCIPIISTLLKHRYKLIVACNPAQQAVLSLEFSNIYFEKLDGYAVHYSKTQFFFPFILLKQIPKIYKKIRYEHQVINRLVEKHQVDFILSDNRYGCWHNRIPCFFITHQLRIQAPSKFLESLFQKINYRFINKFTACLIPDFAGKNNLGGRLSHPPILPKVPTYYLGLLCRMEIPVVVPTNFDYDLCILLSGPEPQRSLLEKKLLQQIEDTHLKIIFVRALPQEKASLTSFNNVIFYNHLKGKILEDIIQKSAFVLTRTGYTSLMELISLKKKTICIPTPGQSEQIYLAQHLSKQKISLCYNQNDFDCTKAIATAQDFDYQFPNFDNADFEKKLIIVFKKYT